MIFDTTTTVDFGDIAHVQVIPSQPESHNNTTAINPLLDAMLHMPSDSTDDHIKKVLYEAAGECNQEHDAKCPYYIRLLHDVYDGKLVHIDINLERTSARISIRYDDMPSNLKPI